jgi:hypothetical protein
MKAPDQVRRTPTLNIVSIAGLSIFLSIGITPPAAHCYPQYQMFSEKHSGRTVNCSLCHINDNGPTGNELGQVGSLTAEELSRLNQARSAMEPGTNVDSPILNEFGNHIIKTIGRKKFLQILTDPSQLAPALGDKSDLDGDGIPDSREYLDGTDPLNKFHGDPWLLFVSNLSRFKFHVILAIIAVVVLDYGLANIIKGSSLLAKIRPGK